MVEVSDSMLAAIGIGIPMLLGFVYFWTNRKDRTTFESRNREEYEGEEERDKIELARKVKKELQDEAEKVELIRKDIAKYVKEEMHEFIEQKIKELKIDRDHIIATYEQKMDTKFALDEQQTNSRFDAMNLVQTQLMTKMVDIARVQADAILKINDAIDALKRLFYELSGKLTKVKEDVDTKQTKPNGASSRKRE